VGNVSPTPRVLIVDDEELIRRVGARMIRARFGADVVEALGGMHALSLWRRDPQAFDVIVIDLDMPEMDGVTLLSRLERLAPDVPVVVWSGRELDPAPPELAAAAALVSKAQPVAALIDALERTMGTSLRRSGARMRPQAFQDAPVKRVVNGE